MSKNRFQRPGNCPYVGKGGLKLEFALNHFKLEVAGLIAADLGCHIGGFTDCLLQHGAAKVYAVDTAYGIFDWKLRNDEQVVLYERTNALHWEPPETVDIVIVDLGWTKQEKSLRLLPAYLKPQGIVLSLVKPQYEADKSWLMKGVVPDDKLQDSLERAKNTIPGQLKLAGEVASKYKGGGGNTEYWFYLKNIK
jgi:23S rRNA (cytidine1920-2'-O)/16S rRNA (cytidine1409-2'-O)-methyltransferase